jgi:dihydrofolate synthase/folylpolyglutamate synthase
LLDIGREKAAIIKRGDRAVSGVIGEGAVPIRRRARRLGVPLVEVGPLPVLRMDRQGLVLRAPGHDRLRLGLLGRHQASNAAVALAVLEALAEQGIATVDPQAAARGLADARWPGRMELLVLDGGSSARPAAGAAPIPGTPDVLLDGAHNPEGSSALAAALDELRPHLSGGRPTLVMAAMADKDVAGMVAALASSVALRAARIIATTVPRTSRTFDAATLAEAWAAARPESREVATEADSGAALGLAIDHGRREDGPVIVCGSLGLVGDVRARLVRDPDLIDPPMARP